MSDSQITEPTRKNPIGQKGYTGNPGGRPKIPEELKVRARNMCGRVFDTWVDIMDNGEKDTDRIKASENIYFLGYGKFVQNVDAEVSVNQIISINKPDFADDM